MSSKKPPPATSTTSQSTSQTATAQYQECEKNKRDFVLQNNRLKYCVCVLFKKCTF
ncbi:hypothetical protein DOY81_000253 [Sarcophaga bullata]|nr:hypothetical protein DOY81_000253 [Sarcophaga bullata]